MFLVCVRWYERALTFILKKSISSESVKTTEKNLYSTRSQTQMPPIYDGVYGSCKRFNSIQSGGAQTCELAGEDEIKRAYETNTKTLWMSVG